MTDGLITYEEAVGLPPLAPSTSSSSTDNAAPDPNDSAPPLTVTPRAKAPPPSLISYEEATAPDTSNAGSAPAPRAKSPIPGFISYEDAIAPDTPNPGGVLSNAPDDDYLTGALKGLGTAAVKAAGDVIGFPTALHNMTDYLLARAESKITGEPVDSVLADLAKKQELQPGWLRAIDPQNVIPAPAAISAPVLAKTGQYVPTTELGKMAQAGAEAALSTVGPGMGAASGTATDLLKAAPGLVLGNAAAGAVGQGATDLTRDPLIGMGAGLAGAGLAGAGAAGAKKLVGPAVLGIPGIDSVPIVGPRVTAARENAAASQILKQSDDPAALRQWAASPPPSPDVPNSPQTLAGSVGFDRGLFQAEKDARNVDNLPFNAIDAAQSGAQQAAIGGIQPDGDVFRPGAFIRQRLDAIDTAAQTASDRLTAAHEAAVAGRAAEGQQAQDTLVQAFQAAHERAARTAAEARAPLDALPPPEQTGAVLRTALQEASDAARQGRNALYQAVDPDGTLATVVTPLKAAKVDIAAAIDPHTGVQPTGAEAKLWSDIDRLPDVVPFKSLQTLDSRVTAAMADARRNPSADDPQALSRLTQLKSAVMDAIHGAVEHQAAHEAKLVDAGLMPADAAIENRIGQALQAEADAFRTARARATGSDGGQGSGVLGSSRSQAVSGVDGAKVSRGWRSGDASSDQSLSSDSGLQPTFDVAAAERLAAAKAAHTDYAQTYKNPTVAPVLETKGFVGDYTLPNGAIPAKAIVAGDKGFETANSFLAAAKNDPRAVAALQDAALAQLRKAIPPAGDLHPGALAGWKSRYDGALRALDTVSPGFSSRFDNAANATQALLDLGVQQKQALADFQRQSAAEAISANRAALTELQQSLGAARGLARDARQTPAGQFAGQVADRIAPAEVENAVGSMLQTRTGGATRMRSLIGSVSQDPATLAGLRKAGVDWIVRNFQNADGTMSGAKFIDFVRDNRDTLKELYGSSHIGTFLGVAHDIEANARWRTQTAIKGGSDTAKNAKPLLSQGAKSTVHHASMLMIAAEAMREGFDRGGVQGAALAGTGAAGAYLLNSLRSAGIRSVADLYSAALADPEKARALLAQMPASVKGGKLQALSGLLRRELLVGQQLAGQQRKS